MSNEISTGGNSQRLEQEQRMHLRLSRQQVRYVRLLEMSEAEAAQDVRRELDENPALEVDADEIPPRIQESETDPVGLLAPDSVMTSRSEFFQPPAAPESLYEHLLAQLDTMSLSPDVRHTAQYIIGNLDTNGYLRREPASMAADMFVDEGVEPSAEQMQQALEAVRSLEPAGTGASNLRESMTLQLQRMKPSEARDDALNIVAHHFNLLASRRFSRITTLLAGNAERAQKALSLLHRLNPKPGAAFGSDSERASYIEPDFFIDIEGTQVQISTGGRVPRLAVSASFEQAVADMERRKRSGRDSYIITRCNDAREYVRLLERRRATLMDVMTAIADLQMPYLLSRGDESLLRPMALRDVASRSGLDLSVISRATKNKYAAMPWGTVPLRFFFSEGFAAKGVGETDDTADAAQVVSGRGIEQAIKNAVGQEDKKHPLSDDAICRRLLDAGYDVSRRTVSKYRDRLGIPVARLRAER